MFARKSEVVYNDDLTSVNLVTFIILQLKVRNTLFASAPHTIRIAKRNVQRKQELVK